MADFSPNLVRAVAIEVKDAVQTLYSDLLAVRAYTNAWTVHCANAALPEPFAVKVALEQYQALKIQALELRSWIAALKTAEPGDGLEAMPPCGGMFNGSTYFDGKTDFTGEG